MAQNQQLFTAKAADGASATVGWNGGRGTLIVAGTFGGGTATLQVTPDGGTTWIAVGTATTLTANGIGNFDLAAGCSLRVNLSGSTAPSLNAWLCGPT